MSFKAKELFQIAGKYDLLSSTRNPYEISDDEFLSFCSDYRKHVKVRDKKLINHLVKNPILFRTFIPYNRNLPFILSQIVWYYDEIIVPDPLKGIISTESLSRIEIQEKKKYLYDVIQFLKKFRESIEEGFILLCSDKAFPEREDNIKKNKTYLNLVDDKEVLSELEKLVDIGIQKLDGKNINGVIARHRGIQSMKFFPTGNTSEAYMSFVDNYEPGTPEDLRELGIKNLLEGEIRDSFIYDIEEIASNLVIAENFNSHPMYSRDVDEVVLRKLDKQINNYKNDYNNTAFEVILPFLEGIPIEALMDLRTKMPSIFEDFRHHMAELVLKIQNEENSSREIVDYKFRSEINRQMLQFDKEQKIALQKTRVIGLGTPILSLAGTLIIQTFGIDLNSLLVISGGAISATELNTLYNYLKNKEEAKTNSLYYLWKAKRKKK